MPFLISPARQDISRNEGTAFFVAGTDDFPLSLVFAGDTVQSVF